jgi:type IV pilus assembly protein PilA
VSTTQATKYVAAITTDGNGVVMATVRNISPSVDTSIIQLTPLASAGTAATFNANSAQSLFGWNCGPAASTGVNRKYLPGSCRQ